MALPLATTEFEMTPVSVLTRLMSSSGATDTPPVPLYRARGAVDMYTLGALIFDARRTRPLVVVTTHKEHGALADVTRLVEIVGGSADIVVVGDQPSTHILDSVVPHEFVVYGGGIRVYAPGIVEDSPREHRALITVDPDDPDRHSRVLTDVERAVQAAVKTRRARHLTLFETSAPDRSADGKALRQKEEIADLRKQVRELKRALGVAQADIVDEERQVFTDPEAQFHHELWLTWLRDTEESERDDTWALRRWVLGPEFLDSLDDHRIASRKQIVKACVDVVTGRHVERSGRKSHKARRAGALATVREDGAELWRCAVNNQTASAARLHWWKREDGVIELAYVGTHDDFRYSR